MTVPSKQDIEKLKKKIELHWKKLDKDGSPRRKFDDNLAKATFRSAIREKWMKCDTKLSFLLGNRIYDMDDSTRTKWLHKCAICGNTFKEALVEVDHIEGEHELTDWSQATEWASKILDVNHSQLQILCIPDHATKSRCEALGLDWRTEEGWKRGLMEQEYTRVCDLKATPQKQWLIERGVTPESNETKRKIQIRGILENDARLN